MRIITPQGYGWQKALLGEERERERENDYLDNAYNSKGGLDTESDISGVYLLSLVNSRSLRARFN